MLALSLSRLHNALRSKANRTESDRAKLSHARSGLAVADYYSE